LRIRRRHLRRGLVAVGCLVAAASPEGSIAGAPGGAPRLAGAGVLLALGSALHLWSKGCLEQNRTLVTAGPYRFTRNPFYLANGLVDLALCVLIGRVAVALPFLGLWALAYHDTIRREEVRLAALFPGAFQRYVAAVPRLIPTGRRLPAAEAVGRFRLANPALARGGEYARILGFWVSAAAIAAAAWLRAKGLAAFAPENATGLGLVVLVPLAWVFKLALAERFRRPASALLPFADAPAKRRAVTAGLVVALYAAARVAAPGSAFAPQTAAGTVGTALASAGALALGLVLAGIVVLPRTAGANAARAGLQAAMACALALFAAAHGLLAFAGAPLLWLALAALDEARSARATAAGLWPMFRPIAMLVPLGTAGLVVAGRLV